MFLFSKPFLSFETIYNWLVHMTNLVFCFVFSSCAQKHFMNCYVRDKWQIIWNFLIQDFLYLGFHFNFFSKLLINWIKRERSCVWSHKHVHTHTHTNSWLVSSLIPFWKTILMLHTFLAVFCLSFAWHVKLAVWQTC